jgi:membrane protease YdiL (CAAX protease family)
VLPALVALGLVSGVLAVRTGNLSRSILLHAGFNLVAVLAVLTNH